MALTLNARYENRSGWNENKYQVVDTAVVFAHAIAAVQHRNNATAAKRGRIQPFAAAANDIPVGFSEGDKITGAAAFYTDPLYQAKIAQDRAVVLLPIASGLAGTPADVMREVYASDDGTFSLTRAAKNMLVGFIFLHYSTAKAYVAVVVGLDQLLHMRAITRFALCLGMISGAIAADAVVKTGFNPLQHYRILATYGQVIEPLSGGGGVLLNLRRTTTDIGGGVITWAAADAAGAKKAGTAVVDSVDSYIHDGDDVRIFADMTAAASTAGLMEVWAEVQTELGF